MRAMLFSLPILAATTMAQETDSVPLFNGRDLTGWVNVDCAPETWGVKEGTITCTGKPTGAMRTVRQYENFVFECEWRHLSSGGNAGIFVWASAISAPGVPFLRAIEVQVLENGYGNTDSHTTHGDVFPIHGSTMVPFGEHRGMRSFPSEQRSKPMPEWNHYRIEANDGVLRLSVNGKEVSGGKQCVWRKGYLALESEGGPTEWRNLRIKELPSTGATPEETAPEGQGHRAIYTGLDLRGWKTESPTAWVASDWTLNFSPAGGSPLVSESAFGDCEILLDFRATAKTLPTDAVTTVVLRGGKLSLPVTGEWERYTITARGNSLKATGTRGNTTEVKLGAEAPAKGSLSLEGGKHELQFANIYVREL